MIAANIMTRDVKCLTADAPLVEAVRLIKDEKIRQLPIVDGEHRVVGVITPRTMLKAILPGYIAEGILKDVAFAPELPEFIEKMNGLVTKRVGEYMDDKFVKITPETSTMEVAAIFVNEEMRVESIMVVDDGDRLLGIISPWDVFKRLCEYREKNES
ncbi:MAG TPA: CBS domain-containing protein [Deltaproteobacteria bacterium]|nr:CBS domain-containing protein [Deltaproteobacteria bacterium]